MPVLDLSGADLKGFDAIPSGTYDAVVYEAKLVEHDKDGGKIAKGTTGVNVQFKITEGGEEGEYFNRRVFRRYWIPNDKGASADQKAKNAKMRGMFVRFLMDLGFSEEEVMSNDFNLDMADLNGKELRVVVGQKPKYGGEEGEMDNEVRGTKPAGAGSAAGSIL